MSPQRTPTFDLDGEQKLTKAKYTGTNGMQEGADDIAGWPELVTLLGTTAPLVLGVLGIVLIVIGLLLLRGGKGDEVRLLATMTWCLPAARRRHIHSGAGTTRTSPTAPPVPSTIDEGRCGHLPGRPPFAMLAWDPTCPHSGCRGARTRGSTRISGSMRPTNRPAINTS